jgi:Uma2 family endonuclease
MSQALRTPKRWTAAEYLEFEASAVERHEFVDGIVYAMVGGTDRHNLISGDLFLALGNHFAPPCQVFEQAMKLRIVIQRAEHFYYPDSLVSCSEADRNPEYREQPILLAEVLSPTTERIDRQEKFEAYQKIPSLREYAIIAQDVPQVEIFRRGNAWRVETFFMNDKITLASVGLTIPVARLYQRVSF